MFRENIFKFMKPGEKYLFVPKNGGLCDYVVEMLPEIYGQLEVDKMFVMGDGQQAFSSIAESIIPFLTILPEITGRSLDFSKVLAQSNKTVPATATTVEPKKIPAKAITKPKRTTTKTKKETETK